MMRKKLLSLQGLALLQSLLLCSLLNCSLFFLGLQTVLPNPSWAQDFDTNTDQDFFNEDGNDSSDSTKKPVEPLPQISNEPPAQFESSEEKREPLPQIRRQRQATDYDRLQSPRRIQHPNAEKGLIRITKDKTYIYKTPRSPQNHAISIRFGMFDPINLANPETGATFADNYPEADSPMLLVEYEWHLWKTAIGKFGAKGGSGFYFANGNGRFKNEYPENSGKAPKEVFSFIAFPNSIGAVYRAQFWDRQIFIPYGDVGVVGFTFAELRDDGKSPKFGFSPGGYGAGGLAINLSSFDAVSSANLDREYGINAVHLLAEYRTIVSFGGSFDLSSDLFNVGFLMEF